MRIERICPNEAEALYTCMKKIDQETQYLLYLPDERSFNKDRFVDDIKHNFYIGVKTDENDILGYLSVHISRLAKIKHIGYIVTGVINEKHHQGLATKMFQETIKWAERKGLRRLELTVITTNTPAVKFYEKLGFKIEGIKHESIYMDQNFYDELYMSMMINQSFSIDSDILES
ncbi:GNAT family N-acetyltransferase [Staphylococcus cohnii]|uniref:GNAT family N-acetyltransferase n=1 Tax=Staphylococcus cohnii TaxID=29382 RepID=UPI000588F2F9|nr:GNAT family N-acetyltransferase [Staphylococcus cohnii]TGP61909.1 GNAT family N-acetyltransferase [bacterium M00.F.Ca.ET.229.01.1.1]TGS38461.1 GNAT family N-acetyltransferase [bacterium M00.F.Ca.ET.180.01.1.1]OIS36170.1 acetyltransferase [Staphylococcus cohnii]OIS36752.1 acetyltransferase [Staphylococcus cohnii]OIS39173.1 acetyltransferase [Staphylococcus cohnii]